MKRMKIFSVVLILLQLQSCMISPFLKQVKQRLNKKTERELSKKEDKIFEKNKLFYEKTSEYLFVALCKFLFDGDKCEDEGADNLTIVYTLADTDADKIKAFDWHQESIEFTFKKDDIELFKMSVKSNLVAPGEGGNEVEIKPQKDLEDGQPENVVDDEVEVKKQLPVEEKGKEEEKEEPMTVKIYNSVIESKLKLHYGFDLNTSSEDFIQRKLGEFLIKCNQIVYDFEHFQFELLFMMKYHLEKNKPEGAAQLETDKDKPENTVDLAQIENYLETVPDFKIVNGEEIHFLVQLAQKNEDLSKTFSAIETAKTIAFIITPDHDALDVIKVILVREVVEDDVKVKLIVDSSFFSYNYTFTIITKRFILKTLEKVIHKIKNDLAPNLLHLQTFQEKSEVIALGEDSFFHQETKVDENPQDENSQNQAVEQDLENETYINIKPKALEASEVYAEYMSETPMEIKKVFPELSQYTYQIFPNSFVHYFENLNYYLNYQNEEKKDSIVYKDMVEPFIKVSETNTYLDYRTLEIEAAEHDKQDNEGIQLKLVSDYLVYVFDKETPGVKKFFA